MLRVICFILSTYTALAAGSAYCLTFDTSDMDDGTTIINVGGNFTPQDNLSDFITLIESKDPLKTIVTFNSPGGNPNKAIALGRIIRLAGLSTVQPRNGECASACALAFMGGVTRLAQPRAIGVHKSSFADTKNLTLEDAVSYVQHQTAETIAYMTAMGIDPAILQLSLTYESDDIRYLSKSEMEQYGITSIKSASQGSGSGTQIAITQPTFAPFDDKIPPAPRMEMLPKIIIPTPKTGKLRTPKGHEYLRLGEAQNSPKRIRLSNGDGVHILGVGEKWYRVRARGETGYLHHNWVKVDQFVGQSFEARYVQIKSFEHIFEVEDYITSSSLPLAAFLATNGWYAITLEKSYRKDLALNLLKKFRDNGSIPEDSFVTTGNTYMVKACCD